MVTKQTVKKHFLELDPGDDYLHLVFSFSKVPIALFLLDYNRQRAKIDIV